MKTIYEIVDEDKPRTLWKYEPNEPSKFYGEEGSWRDSGTSALATKMDGYRRITKREARSLFPNAFSTATKK